MVCARLFWLCLVVACEQPTTSEPFAPDASDAGGADFDAENAGPDVGGAGFDASPDAVAACGHAGNACCSTAPQCDPFSSCSVGTCNGCLAQVSAGWLGACARRADGAGFCWGINNAGQTTDGTNARTPMPDFARGSLVDITVGSAGTVCSVTQTNDLFCWGTNTSAQLGTTSITQTSTPLRNVAFNGIAKQVAVGGAHVCVRKADGGIGCVGLGFDGQRGDGTTSGGATATSVSALGGAATMVSAGSIHSCAVLADGRVRCWGDNAHGQVGDQTTTRRLVPVDVRAGNTALTQASAVCSGAAHSCALRTNGEVWCWGDNTEGQVGVGVLASANPPNRVQNLPAASAITCGNNHTCAIAQGSLYCWGNNGGGQLGDISGPNTSPSLVSLPWLVSSVSGGATHTCALATHGAVYCWGTNNQGELGAGFTSFSSSDPLQALVPCP